MDMQPVKEKVTIRTVSANQFEDTSSLQHFISDTVKKKLHMKERCVLKFFKVSKSDKDL